MLEKSYQFYNEPEKIKTCDDQNIDTICREQYQHIVFINSDRATYISLLNFGPLLVTNLVNWLSNNVGSREDGKWTWFGNKDGKTEFAFSDEGDAAYFALVWRGDNGNNN